MCAHMNHILHGAEIQGLHIQITSYLYIAVSDPKHRLFHLLCLPVPASPITSSCLLNSIHLLGGSNTMYSGSVLHFSPDMQILEKGDGSIFGVAVHPEALMPASA